MPETWHCTFRSTFRLLPTAKQSPLLDVFLTADGQRPDEVLARLPYDKARSQNPGALPDKKRYRDGRQLFRTVGLLYEEPDEHEGRVRVTDLGRAVHRWQPHVTNDNAPVLGRHAAMALAACQLSNPTGEGKGYKNVAVFPFRTIWQVMLALDGRITSDELNRAVFKIICEDDIEPAIELIRQARADDDLEKMGPEVVTEDAKNDRILVWMGWASFGWMLIADKSESGDGSYAIRTKCLRLLHEISRIRHRHRAFENEIEYVQHLAKCAALPPDVR